MIVRKERLPKYVSGFIDRHGKRRYRFRRAGCKGGYFEAAPGTAQFLAEYDRFMASKRPGAIAPRKAIPGSVDALLALYYCSTDYSGNAQPHTLDKRRAVLEAFRAKNGHRPVRTSPYQKLDAYIAGIAAGSTDDKGRAVGGPFAAETARKALTRLFAYGVKLGWRADNPMMFVGYRPKKTEGFHSWTEGEIARYRDHWVLGTKQRLALEIMLWTGKRRSDAVTLGRQHVQGEYLAGRDKKTGKAWSLPIAPQLRAAIDAMPTSDHLVFLVSERGRAYSAASFGNMFRDWCDEAGLPQCSAHGLRKAISRRMAELEIGNAGIKAVTLHSRDDEVAIYTRAADQKRLGKQSIDKLAAWELSNPYESTLDKSKESK